MTPILENVAKSGRHTSFYLSCGRPGDTPIIFMHGWPELSISWRHQLPAMAALGFHAIAPDMRGYGRSSVYGRNEDYRQEEIVADMRELIDHLGAEKAIWVGHDWGAPACWSVAQHMPERCHGVANLCVPYIPQGLSVETVVPFVDRSVYPEAEYPVGQWDYQMYYRENFEAAHKTFDANPRAVVKLLFRAGSAAGKGMPAATSATRRNNGWFGGAPIPDLPRDESVLTAEDEGRYAEGLIRNGFFGPDSWYMNGPANLAFADTVKDQWNLPMPVLFLHAAYDYVCETITSRLAEPMRAHCANLTEAVVDSGHWMAQEKPVQVNANLAKWLSAQFPNLFPPA